MRNILLITYFILGLSSFVIGFTVFRDTLWFHLFALLYALSIALLGYEMRKKLGIKKVKKPVKIRILSYVAVSFVLAGLVFFAGTLLNWGESVRKLSTVGTLFICGILTLLYSIHIVKKNKQ